MSLCFPPLSGNWYQIEKKSPRKGTETNRQIHEYQLVVQAFEKRSPRKGTKTSLSRMAASEHTHRLKKIPRERGRDVSDLAG